MPVMPLMEVVGSNGVVWSGWRDARNTLRRWREENSRKSDLVVELGLPLLKNHSSTLGDEGEMRSDNRVLWLPAHLHPLLCSVVWDVHEQVCTAALDCGDQDTAEVCEFLSSSQAIFRMQRENSLVDRLFGFCSLQL